MIRSGIPYRTKNIIKKASAVAKQFHLKLIYSLLFSGLFTAPVLVLAHDDHNHKEGESHSHTVLGHSFNPQLSLVLDSGFTWTDFNANNYFLPGFQRGNEATILGAGFALNEAELNIQSTIDEYLYGNFTLAFHQHSNHIEYDIEEAFIKTLTLPYNLTLQAGRFYSGIGYLNYHHRDQWDFADVPLIYRAFFNNQYFDDGVQLTWTAPTPFYWQFGAEAFPGNYFPAAGGGDHIGSMSLFTHIGDLEHKFHRWQLGLSYLHTKPSERESLILGGHGDEHHHGAEEEHHHDEYAFSGNSNTLGIDAIWKWAPQGYNCHQLFTFQGELFHRHEDGLVALGDELSSLDSTQNGGYIQAVYQFLPKWRVGYRYDRLWSDNDGSVEEVLNETLLLPDNYDPHQNTFMIDFSPSHYSRIRLQYNQDHSQPELNKQVMLQFIVNMGAHGEHPF